MRKVKVVAAMLCLLTPGLIGGIRPDAVIVTSAKDTVPYVAAVSLSAPATAPASIETTAIVTTTTETETTAEDTTVQETTNEPETTTADTETTVTTTVTETTAPAETALLMRAPATTAAATAVKTTKTAAVTTAKTTTTAKTATTAKTTATTKTTTVTAAEEAQASSGTQTTAVTAPAEPWEGKITYAEYIMLCNVVGHEYGANWVSEYDKALVVEVIMNRVYSSAFPNTIYAVLTQRNQFAGLSRYINLGTFSSQVTASVKAAVNLYFSDPSQFNHGYLYFTGDGYRNYFRTSY